MPATAREDLVGPDYLVKALANAQYHFLAVTEMESRTRKSSLAAGQEGRIITPRQ